MKKIQKGTTEATWGSCTTNKALMSGDIQGVICNKMEFQ